jgi:hypothetical protein
MMNITLVMKDGRKIEHKHTGRAGGSYSKSIRYEGSFAIVSDEWGNDTAYPASDIQEIKTENLSRGW